MARLIQVIETSTLRGAGTDASPFRQVTQYFSPDGRLLAERDETMLASRRGLARALDKIPESDTDPLMIRASDVRPMLDEA